MARQWCMDTVNPTIRSSLSQLRSQKGFVVTSVASRKGLTPSSGSPETKLQATKEPRQLVIFRITQMFFFIRDQNGHGRTPSKHNCSFGYFSEVPLEPPELLHSFYFQTTIPNHHSERTWREWRDSHNLLPGISSLCIFFPWTIQNWTWFWHTKETNFLYVPKQKPDGWGARIFEGGIRPKNQKFDPEVQTSFVAKAPPLFCYSLKQDHAWWKH